MCLGCRLYLSCIRNFLCLDLSLYLFTFLTACFYSVVCVVCVVYLCQNTNYCLNCPGDTGFFSYLDTTAQCC